MKLVLISPPQPYLLDHHTQVPLGVLYLSAVLKRERPAVEVTVVDCSALSIRDAVATLPEADVFGYSCTSLDYTMTRKLKNALHTRFPQATHIIGGPHASALPTDCLMDEFDAVFIREAEKTILTFVDDMAAGIVQEVYCSDTWVDLGRLPRPDREALDWVGGRVLADSAGRKTANIMASRGCQYACAFCASQIMWKRKLRWRTPEDVVVEMQECIEKYGTEVFRFSDDNMTTNKMWTEQFCRLVTPLNVDWRLSFRVDSVTPYLLEKMRKAGCVEAGLGIESFDPRVLRALDKHSTPEQAVATIKMLHEAGMGARVLLMTSAPGETYKKTVADNIAALDSVRGQFVYVSLTMFTPLPGSPVWDAPNRYAVRILSHDLSEYNLCIVRRDKFGGVGRTIRPLVAIDGMTMGQQIENAETMLAYLETLPEYWKGREEARTRAD